MSTKRFAKLQLINFNIVFVFVFFYFGFIFWHLPRIMQQSAILFVTFFVFIKKIVPADENSMNSLFLLMFWVQFQLKDRVFCFGRKSERTREWDIKKRELDEIMKRIKAKKKSTQTDFEGDSHWFFCLCGNHDLFEITPSQ